MCIKKAPETTSFDLALLSIQADKGDPVTKEEQASLKKIYPVVGDCFTHDEGLKVEKPDDADKQPEDFYKDVKWTSTSRKRIKKLCEEYVILDDEDKLKKACDCFVENAEQAGSYSDALLWLKNSPIHEMYLEEVRRREKINQATKECFKADD